ncbi:MAG: helix-turn-helix domain-containing protein [Janthinobacterium lividum]
MAETLSPTQIRGARGMLDWSLLDLARASGVSISTIQRVEAGGKIVPSDWTLAMIQEAFEASGISFLAEDGRGQGVRLKRTTAA